MMCMVLTFGKAELILLVQLYIFFIYKVNGPIQALVRERQRHLLGGVHSPIPKDRQICGHQVHEEKVRLALKSKKTERNPSSEHPVDARKHNKDDISPLR